MDIKKIILLALVVSFGPAQSAEARSFYKKQLHTFGQVCGARITGVGLRGSRRSAMQVSMKRIQAGIRNGGWETYKNKTISCRSSASGKHQCKISVIPCRMKAPLQFK